MNKENFSSTDTSQPIEIVYNEKEESYEIIKGIVDLGYMGVYNTENISVEFDEDSLDCVLEADEDDDCDIEKYIPLKPYISENMSNEEMAKGLTAFYNARIADIKKHQTALNQTFLAYILDDLYKCGFSLWKECKDYIIKDKMPKCDKKDLNNLFYSDESCNAIVQLYKELNDKANNGDIDNSTPAEDIFKRYFPMFNLEKFLADISGEYLSFDMADISFQCSGKGQALQIACGAYAVITINNSFEDWHNH